MSRRRQNAGSKRATVADEQSDAVEPLDSNRVNQVPPYRFQKSIHPTVLFDRKKAVLFGNPNKLERLSMVKHPYFTHPMSEDVRKKHISIPLRATSIVARIRPLLLAAAMKAYSFHAVPIYMFEMVCIFEMLGDTASAQKAFRSFLESQQEFKPTDVDRITLERRDVEEALRQAFASRDQWDKRSQ